MINPYGKIKNLFPGGVNSPVRSCKGLLDEPFMVKQGKGDLLVSIEGKEYIDYCGSWGALIHGHAHPVVLDAVKKRMELGTSFGITTPIEAELGSMIQAAVPSMEMLRFVSSGTEATMSALRLARGYTNRKTIIKFIGCYHGHSDSLLVKAGSGVADLAEASSAGVPHEFIQYTLCLPFNNIDILREAMSEDIAAIIIEPVAANMGVVPASKEFLQVLRDETEKWGAVLIFDEVVTGFRVGYGGAQAHYGIVPDLTCLGKIIGGGFNVAAYGGKKKLMEMMAPLGPVYQAGTLSGNPVAMEAGLQALKLASAPGFYEELERKTNVLIDPVCAFGVTQVGSMFEPLFGKNKFSEFFRFMFDKGIYIPPSQHESWFVSAAHTEEHLAYTAECLSEYVSVRV